MIQQANYQQNAPVPALTEEAQGILPGTYEHYKKKRYQVIDVARHSETLEELVIYLDENQVLWARPVRMFSEKVLLEDGTIVPRFRYIPTYTETDF